MRLQTLELTHSPHSKATNWFLIRSRENRLMSLLFCFSNEIDKLIAISKIDKAGLSHYASTALSLGVPGSLRKWIEMQGGNEEVNGRVYFRFPVMSYFLLILYKQRKDSCWYGYFREPMSLK